MPYFADRGHNTYAVSFRCQGSSDRQSKDKSAGTLASHSADLEHFISTLPKPPVILAHSFGGLIAQRYACKICTSIYSHGALQNPVYNSQLHWHDKRVHGEDNLRVHNHATHALHTMS